MRLEKQNRRSCIALIIFLALLTAGFFWLMLGGAPTESTADDVQGSFAPAGPAPQPRAPAGTG